MKTILLFFCSVLALMFLSRFSTAVTDEPLLERIQVDAFSDLVRPAAVFSHDDHNEAAELEEDCSVCHHVYEGKQRLEGESSEDSPCADCHTLKTSDENSISLRVAFHTRCKSCHFDSDKGPVLCGECHIRKERIQ